MSTEPTTSKIAFIGALEDWFMALRENPRYAEPGAAIAAKLRPVFPTLPEGTHPLGTFCEHIYKSLSLSRYDLIIVTKSNYLYRRLYLHQRHRLNPCPVCKGKWGLNIFDGCVFCGCTGWLP